MLKRGFSLILRGIFGSFCLLLLNIIFYCILYLIFFLILFVLHLQISINDISLPDNCFFYSAIIISTIIVGKLFKNINNELLITTMIFYSLNLFFILHSSSLHIVLTLFTTLFVYFLPNLIQKIKFFNKLNCHSEQREKSV